MGGGKIWVLQNKMEVVIPVGIGVVVGIVGVSNALRWLLDRYEKPTLGVLLGLLVGAVVGLYPFQEAVPPQPGFEIHGAAVPVEELADVERKDWPLARYSPSSGEVGACVGAAFFGLFVTAAIARVGREPEA